MTQPTFKHIEDYIEYIAGYRDKHGATSSFFHISPSPISLARYDVNIVDSLAMQTLVDNKPYTDRQAALAVKIVNKYRRQFSNLTPPVQLPDTFDCFRLGIREVDRATSVKLVDDEIHLKFPYHKEIIATVQSYRENSAGHMRWDSEARIWSFALSEYNLTVALGIARQSNFDFIDPKLLELEEKIKEVENNRYSITLIRAEDGFSITNAADSLVEYINEHLGGFGKNNLVKLVDAAATLGYTVDPELSASVPNLLKRFVADQRRVITIKRDEYSLDEIVEYAKAVDRLPIYLYTTDLPSPDTDIIKYLNRGKAVDIKPKLMISTSALMIGNKKQAWLANAERVIIVE